MPSFVWTQDLVRCPVDRLLVNTTTDYSTEKESALIRQLLDRLDAESAAGQDAADFSSSTSSYLTLALATEALIFALVIAWRFHGVGLMEMNPDTRRRQVRRHYSPITENKMWIAYFAVQFVMHCIAAVAVEVSKWHENLETQRILILLQRVFLGFTSLILVTALNNHRLDKIRDHDHAAASSALKRQAKQMNMAAIGVFFVAIVCYFVSSHAVENEESQATEAMYWVYISALLVITFPPLLATFWISFHDAAMQPSKVAKVALALAVAQRLCTIYPPSLWNQHVLSAWVERSPCPFANGKMSFYDMILVIHLISNGLLLLFVVLEHRRNAMSCLADHYALMSQQLEEAVEASEAASSASNTPNRRLGNINS
jgi:hypothetical protein